MRIHHVWIFDVYVYSIERKKDNILRGTMLNMLFLYGYNDCLQNKLQLQIVIGTETDAINLLI